eukprot:scaffold1177_cov126-Isochrysis_galbana.AAC.5
MAGSGQRGLWKGQGECGLSRLAKSRSALCTRAHSAKWRKLTVERLAGFPAAKLCFADSMYICRICWRGPRASSQALESRRSGSRNVAGKARLLSHIFSTAITSSMSPLALINSAS